MATNEQVTTRSRAQQQLLHDWELEREQFQQQIQNLQAQVEALRSSVESQPPNGQPSEVRTASIEGSTTQTVDIMALIKSLKDFHGISGVQPSAKSWTSMLKAYFNGCSDSQVLAYLPSKLKSNAFHWYELQVCKVPGQPWTNLSDFCNALTAHFPWEESLDDALDKWDKMLQRKQETVMQ